MLEDRIIITVMYVSETISNSRPKIWDILPTELTNLPSLTKLMNGPQRIVFYVKRKFRILNFCKISTRMSFFCNMFYVK